MVTFLLVVDGRHKDKISRFHFSRASQCDGEGIKLKRVRTGNKVTITEIEVVTWSYHVGLVPGANDKTKIIFKIVQDTPYQATTVQKQW